jgi:tetratricopeptide (TPR) repeat protein
MNDAESCKAEGNEAFAKKDYDKAIECYTKSLTLTAAADTPSLADAATVANDFRAALYSNRSMCYLKLKSVDQALDDAKSCISVAPHFVKGYFRAHAAAEAAGKLKDAIRYLEAGLSLPPEALPPASAAALDKELYHLQTTKPIVQLYETDSREVMSKAVLALQKKSKGLDIDFECFDRDRDLLHLIHLATDKDTVKNSLNTAITACEILMRMKVIGISRLVLPFFTGEYEEGYSDIEVAEGRTVMFGEELGNTLGSFCQLVLSDGAKAFEILLYIVQAVRSTTHTAKPFQSAEMCLQLLMIVLKEYPANPIVSFIRVFDVLLALLLGADKCPQNPTDSQSFYLKLCHLVLISQEWKKDPRVLPAVRRCFMKDAVDLSYYGSWKNFLKEHNLPCLSDTDKELEARTSAVDIDRRAWMQRLYGATVPMMTGFVEEDETVMAKCLNRYCDSLRTEQEPFAVACDSCHEKLYCSTSCKRQDFNAHMRTCKLKGRPVSQEEKNSSAKLQKPDTLMSRPCDNCGIAGGEVRVCEGCGKVRFCSLFCADYAMQRGVHGKKCILGPRQVCYYDSEPHDDLEHPAKCIICHERFNEREPVTVVGPCTYKRRYCMCKKCHSQLEVSGSSNSSIVGGTHGQGKQHCPFCRLALKERI